MEEKYVEKIIENEQRGKSNTKRLDEHDKEIRELQDTTAILKNMNFRMEKVEVAVEKIDKKLDSKVEEKGAKWDKLVDYLFYFVLACFLGYIAYKLGLK